MPGLDISLSGVSAVEDFETTLSELLDEAAAARPNTDIGQPLTKCDFKDFSQRVGASLPDNGSVSPELSKEEASSVKKRLDSIIEAAARVFFSKLIVSTPIDSPDFSRMWHLLDIVWAICDDEICDPTLPFILVEDLLESQTIPGCRIVLDYLESRRERIVAKGLNPKQIPPLLRSCNELLRRLSRAEDTAFCGRVFIFLFQSLPMGDRSSTNMKGEFHIDNVTSFEETKVEDEDTKMEVDTQVENQSDGSDSKKDGKPASKVLSTDELYPMFWSLQESFSQPEKLFDTEHFEKFKKNMEAVIEKFKDIQPDESNRNARAATSLEDAKAGLKRKRIRDEHDEPLEVFHPKYLTSKDLFELEIGDVVFRRHILIQALIIMHFLLSLSPKGKEKIASIGGNNKAVHYSYDLSEEDTKWTTEMKTAVERQLRPDNPSVKFYRVVDTVLARDKNWVYWKLKACPPIERKPVEPEYFAEAKAIAQRAATSKRLRPNPLGALSLDFLREDTKEDAMDAFKAEERYLVPELDGFKRSIADDDFEIGMPTSDETKVAAVAGKASKSWRALRVAGRFKLPAFDKIDDPQKIDAVFEEIREGANGGDDDDANAEDDAPDAEAPEDVRPIIVSGPAGVGKSTLIRRLQDAQRGIFKTVVRHTTRPAADGETDGEDFHFVSAQAFNQLRDGDRLVEHSERGGVSYGTSTKVVDAIVDNDKVPVIELDMEAARFAKDMDFSARYVLVKPSSAEALSARLSKAGKDDGAIKVIVDKLPEQLDEDSTAEVYDISVVNDEEEVAGKELMSFVYRKEGEEGTNGDVAMGEGDSAEA